jgi:hypothetical protein
MAQAEEDEAEEDCVEGWVEGRNGRRRRRKRGDGGGQ